MVHKISNSSTVNSSGFVDKLPSLCHFSLSLPNFQTTEWCFPAMALGVKSLLCTSLSVPSRIQCTFIIVSQSIIEKGLFCRPLFFPALRHPSHYAMSFHFRTDRSNMFEFCKGFFETSFGGHDQKLNLYLTTFDDM